jgi:sulfur carrier protein ThiS
MTACIHPFGILKSYTGGQTAVTVKAGRTVREVVTDVGIPPDIVALVTVNDEPQTRDYCLQDGDDVKLIAVVGGG